MFCANHGKEALFGVGTEVEMLLVVIGARGVHTVGAAGLAIPVFAITAVQKLTITKVEVDLQPLLGVRNRPEIIGTQMDLWDGLGIGAFDKRTAGKQVIPNHLFVFTTANLHEERPISQIHKALLQIGLVVCMDGCNAVQGGG